MDVVVAVVSLSIGHIWSSLTRRLNYIRYPTRNLDLLNDRFFMLDALRRDVCDMVDLGARENMMPLESVNMWLSNVEGLMSKLQRIEHIDIETGRCFYNCKSRYKYAKRIALALEEVESLLAYGHFDRVAIGRSVTTEQTAPISLDLKQSDVWSRLNSEQVGIIGICGKCGVGKTTLLKRIGEKFHDSNTSTPIGFDVVIWVTMSDLRLAKVQEDIAKMIGILDDNWRNKTIDEKSMDIFTELHKKKFLLLLDDIWDAVDLANFGVPLPNSENGSKIVFTTWSEDVCREMEAQMVIDMRDGVWENVAPASQPSVQPATQAGSEKNARKSLKKTTTRIFTRASTRLSENEMVENAERPTSTLQENQNSENARNDEPSIDFKQRYDSLPNSTVKFCFLYCTLFPPNFRILKDDLIHYWIYENFECNESGVGTHKEGYYIIDNLVRLQLLEDEGKYVKMQRIIRDVGLQMTEHFLVQAASQLAEAPDVGKWKEVRRISLMENSIQNLEKVPACDYLRTLFLSRNPCLVLISGDFFVFMKSLTVLDMSMSSIQELPAEISNLVSLQYLNLSRTPISRLPVELNLLKTLKYLNLEHTIHLTLIPREVICRLLWLEVLKMFRCGFVNEELEDSILSNGNLHIEELQLLKYLKALSMTIRHSSPFQLLFSTDQLRRFTQALFLEHLIGSASLSLLEDVKGKAVKCSNVESQTSSFIAALSRNICFNSLQEVRVEKCFDLQDLTWVILAPNLKILTVTKCAKIEEIISNGKLGDVGDVGERLKVFTKLEVLELEDLPRMGNIYREALAFSFLERIEILNCPLLKKLPLDSNSANGGKVVIKAEECWWNDLEWTDDDAKIAFLPCFRTF